MKVTDEERAGRTGRIEATRLLRTPAFAPFLRGIEPYTQLLGAVRQVASHDDAVLEFPYDWRLSIEHNAALLAEKADKHLTGWRAHLQGSREARLVLVAHSMGGLVARYFAGMSGVAPELRGIVTLGTPFYGAVKAAALLNTGLGSPVPLPRRRLRDLAVTLPGMYDLLPSYRCVDEGGSARRLTSPDVGRLGGNGELAAESFARRERLLAVQNTNLRALVGVQQPTMQSLVLDDGVVEPKYYTCEDDPAGGLVRVDRRGDSTVYRDAAVPAGLEPAYLPQAHGALAKTDEAIAHACAVISERTLGPPLGEGGVGLRLPDVVTVSRPFEIVVSGTNDPTGVTCRVHRAHPRIQVDRPPLFRRNGELVGQMTFEKPDLYTIEINSGTSAVCQMVLAVAPQDLDTAAAEIPH